jgi:hypothetical protein
MAKMLGMRDKKSMCTRAGKEAEKAAMKIGGIGDQFQAGPDQLSRRCRGSADTTEEEGYQLKMELVRL